MNYSTQIDTIAIQIDCDNHMEQQEILKQLFRFTLDLKFYISNKEHIIGANNKRLEHFIYLNGKTFATINTGVFRSGSHKDKYEMKYYINIKFAGLKSYNEILDQASYNYLLSVCAFLNTLDITFKLTELDVSIDVSCPFDNLLTICTKKSPKTDYYNLDSWQRYDTTTYIEKITKKKLNKAVLRAYTYDKSFKEELDYPITRFELKLQSKYFNKYGFSIDSIKKALDRYYVMYFKSIEEKHNKIIAYNKYKYVRKRELEKLSFNSYRITANMDYIEEFISILQTVDYRHLLTDLIA